MLGNVKEMENLNILKQYVLEYEKLCGGKNIPVRRFWNFLSGGGFIDTGDYVKKVLENIPENDSSLFSLVLRCMNQRTLSIYMNFVQEKLFNEQLLITQTNKSPEYYINLSDEKIYVKQRHYLELRNYLEIDKSGCQVICELETKLIRVKNRWKAVEFVGSIKSLCEEEYKKISWSQFAKRLIVLEKVKGKRIFNLYFNLSDMKLKCEKTEKELLKTINHCEEYSCNNKCEMKKQRDTNIADTNRILTKAYINGKLIQQKNFYKYMITLATSLAKYDEATKAIIQIIEKAPRRPKPPNPPPSART